jgi:hypothetical protein
MSVELNLTSALQLIDRLIEKLVAHKIRGTITIYGGVAVARNLPHYRRVTTDIDVVSNIYGKIEPYIEEIRRETPGLDKDWMNGAIIHTMYGKEDKCPDVYYDNNDLKVQFGSKEYLLAMKTACSRKSVKDCDDAARLFNLLKLKDVEDIEDIVYTYYDVQTIGRQQIMFANDIVDRAKGLKSS